MRSATIHGEAIQHTHTLSSADRGAGVPKRPADLGSGNFRASHDIHTTHTQPSHMYLPPNQPPNHVGGGHAET